MTDNTRHIFQHPLTIILALIIGLSLYRCAQPVMPEGGMIDEQAPSVIEKGTTPNFQTNFEERRIEIAFDEFIKLVDPTNQIILSPPTEYPLQKVVKGKKLLLRFDSKETLLENTTYTIQFGEAIQDITEGNPVQNLRYVFSTGGYIDSLSILAKVTDSESNEAAENVLVLLYENPGDTVLRKEKPLYFTRTDTSGVVRLENLKAGKFQLYALEEENNNYIYDTPDERIAFSDSMVSSRYQPNKQHELLLFKDIEPPVVLDGYRLKDDLWQFQLEGDDEYLQWELNHVENNYDYKINDSLFIWTKNRTDSAEIVFYSAYSERDTFVLSNLETPDNKSSITDSLRLKNWIAQIGERSLILRVEWSLPLISMDSVRILFKDTSGLWMDLKYELDSTFEKNNEAGISWKSSIQPDSLLITPGAFRSYDHQSDSLWLRMRYRQLEDLSDLTAQFIDLDSTAGYLCELQTLNGEMKYKTSISDSTRMSWYIPAIRPMEYKLVVVKDLNRNGRWDGGFFDYRQLPEPRYEQEVRNLRADWDVIIDVKPGF